MVDAASRGSILAVDATFRRFWFARVTSMLGSAFTRLVLPIEVFHRTGSGSLVALVTTVSLSPVLVLGIPSGVVADRTSRVQMMRVCEAGSCVLSLLLAVVAGVLSSATWPIFVAVGAISVLAVFFDAAVFGAIAAMVESSRLAEANSLLYGANTVLTLLAPVVGGALYAASGLTAVLILDAVTFLIAALLLLGIPRDRPTPPAGHSSALADLGVGLSVIAKSALLRFLVLAGAASAVAGGALTASLVLLTKTRLDQGDAFVGVLVSGMGAGAFTGSLLLARLSKRVPQTTIALGFMPVATLAAAAIAVAPDAVTLVSAALVWGLAYTVLIINNVTLRQLVLPASLQGRVNTTARTIAWGGEPIGAAVFAALVALTSVRSALLICTVPLALAALLAFGSQLRTRDINTLTISDPAPAPAGS